MLPAITGTIAAAACSRTPKSGRLGEKLLSVANPPSTLRIFRQPIHPMLVPIPIACFVGVLLTDLTYWWSADMMWADFSAWLVTVGVIFGFLAAIFGLIDFLGNRSIRAQGPAWPHAIGNRRAARPGHAQHVRSFARRLDLGRAVGPRAFRRCAC